MQRSSLALLALAQLLLLAAGCGEEVDTDAAWQEGYDEGYAAGKDEVDDLAALVATLEARLAEVEGAVTENSGDIAAIEADYLTRTDLSGYATEAWVGEQGYLTSADLVGYATEAWVGDQGYLTSADLVGYATESWVTSQAYATAYDLGVVDFDLGLLDGRVTAIQADYLTSADLAGYATESWVAGLGFALETDLTLAEGRLDTLEDEVGALDLDSFVQLIDADTTIAVTTATELSSAIAGLDGYLIAADATVTIELAAGTYAFTSPLYFSHPSGDRVVIQGADAATTILYFPSSDGLMVEGGATLGYVSDVTVMGAGASGTRGVVATDGSQLGLGVVTVTNFGDDCVTAEYSSTLIATDGLVVSDCGSHGVLADAGSFIYATSAVVSDCGASGLVAGSASALWARYSESSSNGYYGFLATGNGAVDAYYSSSDTNGTAGYYAYKGGVLAARYSTATGNPYGYDAVISALVDAGSSTASGNTYDYRTEGNSFIYASGAAGTTKSTNYNDTTDWIYGK